MATINKFNSLEELYQRLLPALNTKVVECKRANLKILEKDIWRYCIKNKWANKKDLQIHELVDDILSLDPLQIRIYKEKNN